MGKPLMIGLSILATLLGVSTYLIITLVWRWRTLARRRRGRRGVGNGQNGQ
jgi:uncharacterized protein